MWKFEGGRGRILKFVENFQLNCKFEESVSCVLCDGIIVNLNRVSISHMLPISGLKIEEEQTTTLQNSDQIY
jgi:hypothetical protein